MRTPLPIPVLLLSVLGGCSGNYVDIDLGRTHGCAVRAGGAAVCWGENGRGELGTGEQVRDGPVKRPARIAAPGPWTSIAVEDSGGCAVHADGPLWCWGVDPGPGPTPAVVEEAPWRSVTAFTATYCGVRADDTAACWGANARGNVGNGEVLTADGAVVPLPADVADPGPWHAVVAGAGQSCGLKTDGTLWCWGGASGGGSASALGLGGFPCDDDREHCLDIDTTVPVQVGDATWVDVSTANGRTCGVRSEGTLWCWGETGEYGELGGVDAATAFPDWADHCTQPCTPVPLQVGSDTDWRDVELGHVTACGIKGSGALWCWGIYPPVGEAFLPEPEPVDIEGRWDELSLNRSMCGIRDDRSAWCWGENERAQLGDGTTTDRRDPVRLGG